MKKINAVAGTQRVGTTQIASNGVKVTVVNDLKEFDEKLFSHLNKQGKGVADLNLLYGQLIKDDNVSEWEEDLEYYTDVEAFYDEDNGYCIIYIDDTEANVDYIFNRLFVENEVSFWDYTVGEDYAEANGIEYC